MQEGWFDYAGEMGHFVAKATSVAMCHYGVLGQTASF